jgi:GTP-binding protein EngB required for normal cell division
MSPAVSTEVDALRSRLATLREIADLGAGRLEDAVLARLRTTTETSAARLGHGTSHTVVALAGATGSGKSSLFNAVTGTEWATTGIRRPTTSSPQAAVYGDGAAPLLDWLQIADRQRHEPGELDGLVLLDLPDHDSTAAAHRLEVDRLVTVVDVFAWVVDPQKYADAALHEGYLRRFGGHEAVTVVLLNQVDRLDGEARSGTVTHLKTLLADDGLTDVRVLPVSATTGEGVEAFRRELAARVAERRAVVTRIDADLDWLATDLATVTAAFTDRTVSPDSRAQLVAAATRAAGGPAVEAAVEAAYRHRGALAVGWPVVRWVRRARPDPLSRLGLGGRRTTGVSARAAAGGAADAGVGADAGPVVAAVRRTAIAANPMAVAQLDEALRHLAQQAGQGLPEPARTAVERAVTATGTGLPDALDEAAGGADLQLDPPRWWRVLAALQWLASTAMVVGVVWLLALWALAWLRLPEPPAPAWHAFPLPSLLAVGGAAVGLLVAATGRRLAAWGGRRRGRRAGQSLAARVAVVVDRDVVAPMAAELAELGELRRALARL